MNFTNPKKTQPGSTFSNISYNLRNDSFRLEIVNPAEIYVKLADNVTPYYSPQNFAIEVIKEHDRTRRIRQ